MFRQPIISVRRLGWFAILLAATQTLVTPPTSPAAGADDVLVLARVDPRAPVEPAEGRRPPGLLSDRDAALYQQIFRVQEAGKWARADALIARLGDPLLLGHVQFQRYMHPTAYRSSYAELEAWLRQYGDHPGAERVHRLARKRRPAGAPAPDAPLRGALNGAGQNGQELVHVRYRSDRARTTAEAVAVRDWRGEVGRLAAAGHWRAALNAFERGDGRRLADAVETDLARWALARGYFAAGQDHAALDLARRAARGSGAVVPELHWTAGISAWRLGRIGLAAEHFSALAEAGGAHRHERARAAFWAARAQLVVGEPERVGRFLGIAAAEPHDFYGLLARAVLGEETAYGWDDVGLEQRALRVLLRHPGARRAMALGQVGRADLAEAEIRKLAIRAEPELMAGLIALADSLHLPAAQMRLAQRLGLVEGRRHHGALFPIPRWRPATGLRVDRALLFAVIRAESAFDPGARSHVGALGVMQVMPGTAKHMARVAGLGSPDPRALHDPETGMAFGQAYLEHLLQHRWIGDNLIYIAAGYNAGPGRVIEWQKAMRGADDPLLFLESIPMTEPRVYVKKVLTNLWIYRARLGQPQPSLEAFAENRWPRYQSLDPRAVQYARN